MRFFLGTKLDYKKIKELISKLSDEDKVGLFKKLKSLGNNLNFNQDAAKKELRKQMTFSKFTAAAKSVKDSFGNAKKAISDNFNEPRFSQKQALGIAMGGILGVYSRNCFNY